MMPEPGPSRSSSHSYFAIHVLISPERFHDPFCDGADDGHDHGVSELFVGGGVSADDLEVVGVAHELATLIRSEASRVLSALFDEDFGAILVIPGAESP